MSAAQIGNLQVRLGIDSAEFSNGVRAIQGSLGSLAGSLKAFAGAAAATQIGSLAVDAIKAVAEIGDVAESIGISAEQLQVFQKMAIASGTSTDVLTRGLQSIAEQSVDTGSKLAQLFEANGLTVKGKEVNQVIREFMDLVKNARTPAEQLAMITDVLGDKVGRQLVESFRAGAGGVDKQYARMASAGEIHLNAEVARIQQLETEYNKVTDRIAVYWQKMIVNMVEGASRIQDELASGKPSAASELLNWITGGQVQDWNITTGDLIDAPRTSGFGTAGGPNEFASPPVPVKITVRPPSKAETDKTKKKITKSLSPVYVTPVTMEDLRGPLPDLTIEDIRGPALELQNLEQQLRDTDVAMKQFADDFTSGLASSLAEAAMNAGSLSDAFQSLKMSALDALGSIAQQLLRTGLNSLFGLGGTAFGGAMGFAGFGGFYASGGSLGAGKWGIAGESGPEIVHGPARITPVDKMSGSTAVSWSPSIVINGSADQRQIGAVMAAEREKFKADLPKLIRDARKRGRI